MKPLSSFVLNSSERLVNDRSQDVDTVFPGFSQKSAMKFTDDHTGDDGFNNQLPPRQLKPCISQPGSFASGERPLVRRFAGRVRADAAHRVISGGQAGIIPSSDQRRVVARFRKLHEAYADVMFIAARDVEPVFAVPGCDPCPMAMRSSMRRETTTSRRRVPSFRFRSSGMKR